MSHLLITPPSCVRCAQPARVHPGRPSHGAAHYAVQDTAGGLRPVLWHPGGASHSVSVLLSASSFSPHFFCHPNVIKCNETIHCKNACWPCAWLCCQLSFFFGASLHISLSNSVRLETLQCSLKQTLLLCFPCVMTAEVYVCWPCVILGSTTTLPDRA